MTISVSFICNGQLWFIWKHIIDRKMRINWKISLLLVLFLFCVLVASAEDTEIEESKEKDGDILKESGFPVDFEGVLDEFSHLGEEFGPEFRKQEKQRVLPAVLSVLGIIIIGAVIIAAVVIKRRKQGRSGSTKAEIKADSDMSKSNVDDTNKRYVSRAENSPGRHNPDYTTDNDLTTSQGPSTLARSDPLDSEAKMYENPGYCSIENVKREP